MVFYDGDVVKSFVYTKSIELQNTNVQCPYSYHCWHWWIDLIPMSHCKVQISAIWNISTANTTVLNICKPMTIQYCPYLHQTKTTSMWKKVSIIMFNIIIIMVKWYWYNIDTSSCLGGNSSLKIFIIQFGMNSEMNG